MLTDKQGVTEPSLPLLNLKITQIEKIKGKILNYKNVLKKK